MVVYGGVWLCMVVTVVYINVFALIRRTQRAALQECSVAKCPSANPAGAAAAAAATKKTR